MLRRDEVVFRGTKQGLLIVLSDEVAFPRLLQRLTEKLAAADSFFSGAEVTVDVGQRTLSDEQLAELRQCLQEPHGLILKEVVAGVAQAAVAPQPARRSETPWQPGENPWAPRVERSLVVNRTVRSGQAIRHAGDIVVLGDVNPGAELVAGGHIIVMGALRGVAHAGATGDETALVVALRLSPTQLRIGTIIGRPPDQGGPGGELAEVARVQDGAIVIESCLPQGS